MRLAILQAQDSIDRIVRIGTDTHAKQVLLFHHHLGLLLIGLVVVGTDVAAKGAWGAAAG